MSLAIRASVTRLPVSPRKARLVVDVVRGMPVEIALAQLQYLPNKSSEYVSKLIKSAAANAEENFGLLRDELYVAEIYADEGPRKRGGRFGGRGRFKPMIHRSCHLGVALKERNPVDLSAPPSAAAE
ncbi:MAG: 50S ribosomal protein L22 [Ardenticatenales bacterium]